MDAVHNLPSLLVRWEGVDEALILSYLKAYDERWSGSLADLYARVRAGGEKYVYKRLD